jgi:hypothetical protein
MRVAAALLVLTAVSVALRTGALDAGYWIDEAIAVGIASHEPAEIPRLLLQDGSPPLYYLLLHAWIGLAGTGEAAARSLSLLFAVVRRRTARGPRRPHAARDRSHEDHLAARRQPPERRVARRAAQRAEAPPDRRDVPPGSHSFPQHDPRRDLRGRLALQWDR